MRNPAERYKNKGDLTTGPILRHLLRLTIPMIWGLFAVISLQLIDMYFIGLLGTTELAAISFTFPVTMAISHLIFGVNIALSSVVSRLVGEKRQDEARRVILHGIMLAVLTSMIGAGLCYIFLEPLFTLLGADADTYPFIAAYMPLWLIASVVMAVPVNGNSAIRAATGDSFTPAVVMTVLAVVNAVLDPILIFGWFGLPAMGVAGAAAATLIAYGVCFVLELYILIWRKKLLPTDSFYWPQFGNSLKRLVHIAIPAGIGNTIQPITNAVIVAVVAGYGASAVAAYGVGTRIEAFSLLLVIALALGMAPIVGQNWGAQQFPRVHKTINLAILINFVWSALVAVALAIFAAPVAGIFSQDPEVINIAVLFFYVVPFSYAFANLVFGWGSAFNAMGKPQRAFMMIFTKAFIITLPAVFIGSWLYGLPGVFGALAISNVASGIAFHLLSRYLCRRDQAQQNCVEISEDPLSPPSESLA